MNKLHLIGLVFFLHTFSTAGWCQQPVVGEILKVNVFKNNKNKTLKKPTFEHGKVLRSGLNPQEFLLKKKVKFIKDDQVITKKDVSVKLKFGNDRYVKINENTTITILVNNKIKLEKGEIFMNKRKRAGAGEYYIETNTTSAGVPGTELLMRYFPEKDTTELLVINGTVKFTASDSTILVGANTAAFVSGTSVPAFNPDPTYFASIVSNMKIWTNPLDGGFCWVCLIPPVIALTSPLIIDRPNKTVTGTVKIKLPEEN